MDTKQSKLLYHVIGLIIFRNRTEEYLLIRIYMYILFSYFSTKTIICLHIGIISFYQIQINDKFSNLGYF